MLLICIFWYTGDPYWYIFQKFNFSPIIKSMFSLYNLSKGGEARFSTGKLKNFDSGLMYGKYTHGCGGTRFLRYVCQIDTP